MKFTSLCNQPITAVASFALDENDLRVANLTFAIDETGMREQVRYTLCVVYCIIVSSVYDPAFDLKLILNLEN